MSKFRVASRFDERYKNEKCPQCRTAFQDFMELFSNFKERLGSVLGEIIMCIGDKKTGHDTQKKLLINVAGLLDSIPDVLGCYSCGTLVVPRGLKDSEWAGKKDQLEKQLAEVKDFESEDGKGFKCTMLDEGGKVCGKVCKNKLGLMAHQRTHGANPKS